MEAGTLDSMAACVTLTKSGKGYSGKMALPKPPSPLTQEEREVLSSKFEEHEISGEQEERQAKFREKLQDSE